MSDKLSIIKYNIPDLELKQYKRQLKTDLTFNIQLIEGNDREVNI